MSTHPEVLWAQRSSKTVSEKNVIYLTVNLADIHEPTLEYALTATSLSFKARTSGGQTDYAFDLEFFADVDPEKSTKRLTSRALALVLCKKESKSEYWPRLTKDKQKTPYIKTDFGKWVDEDEQDGNPGLDDDADALGGFPGGMGGDFDLSKFSPDLGSGISAGAGAGIGHAEGQDDDAEESDDEGPPALEDPKLAE